VRTRIAWTLAATWVAVASAAACGARTGLDVPTTHRGTSSSTGGDGGSGGHIGSGGTSPSSSSNGGSSEGGAGGFPDAGPKDATPDVLPPNDAQPDVVQIDDCVEAGITYIYVITSENTLLHYTPPNTFVTIGPIDCPSTAGPFSMGVDHLGTAYVVFQDGNLFKISGATAHCKATSFVPDQDGFHKFGMAFSANDSGSGGGGGSGPGETLYVAESSYKHLTMGLATIDVDTFQLNFVAPLSPILGDAVELTGTRDGRLFAFGLQTAEAGMPGSHLAEVDKTTGALLSDVVLPVGTPNSSFAFAYYGGDFYLFTDDGMGGPTFVTQYDPTDGSTTQVASLGMNVVGVGVSTCAPQ
jgi:hypothetical protein